MTPEDVNEIQFRKPTIGHRGYDEQSVDALMDRIEHTLRGRPEVTREELGSVSFPHPPIGKRGYRKQDVDAFLQQVIDQWP